MKKEEQKGLEIDASFEQPKILKVESIFKPATGKVGKRLKEMGESIGRFLAELYDNYLKTRD